MKTVYVVIAYDATAYRLTRVFSTEENAQAFKVTLKELLWQKITIDRCYVDEQQNNRMPVGFVWMYCMQGRLCRSPDKKTIFENV